MWIVNLEANPNGSHNDHRADHITTVLDGWAMIPDGFEVPSTFPFVSIEAEEVTHHREVEVLGETDGRTETRPYTVMTVVSMTEGTMPDPVPEDIAPSNEERIAALESENNLLKFQISAQSEQMDFYEDCIAEMAAIVYA